MICLQEQLQTQMVNFVLALLMIYVFEQIILGFYLLFRNICYLASLVTA